MYVLVIIFGIASADIIINTNSGPIQGTASLAEDVDAFLGIPYAEPPVNELRFAKTVPKKNWTEVHSATQLPPPCPQYDLEIQYYFMPDISNMSEDCLYLNIWVPKLNNTGDSDLKPVVIFIHPGAFMTGSSNLPAHDGSRLASRGDVIVVTMNYRLGSFGFLMANIEEANGNMGMYDQIMAIKWVKDNIKYFGGDPDNIVLMGSSAGAISIAAHMISPLSKHLFKRAILQSGSIIHPLLSDDNAGLFENSKLLARLVGCTNESTTLENDPQSVVKCLKQKPKEAFIEAEKTIYKTYPAVFYPRANDDFLPKSSVELFREGRYRNDMSVMMGFTEEEGTLLLMAAAPEFFGNYGRNYEHNMNKYRALSFGRSLLMAFRQSNISEIINPYMKQVKNRTPMGYVKMVANIAGDFTIACGTVFLADFLAVKGNPVYFYKFSARPASTPLEEWMGTTHLDELQYIFGNPYHENFTEEEIERSECLMDHWSAFARTGFVAFLYSITQACAVCVFLFFDN